MARFKLSEMFILRLFFLLGMSVLVRGRDVCFTKDLKLEDCANGCCQDGIYYQCCSLWPTTTIVGTAIACGVSVIITALVTFICWHQYKAGLARRKIGPGQIIMPSVISTGQMHYGQQSSCYPQYGYSHQQSTVINPPPYPGSSGTNQPPPYFDSKENLG